ncbi:hypothetical protein POTOM_021425 [Populus tomentosa]|uniref:P-type ATPase A domain-containing protein n=1 Tax=Populus tomentosa TaxID=118781 RepID=A0A8X7ZR49_POPTO|nr:hypothetical protein POTOM_021425 [Populus tomentosa]
MKMTGVKHPSTLCISGANLSKFLGGPLSDPSEYRSMEKLRIAVLVSKAAFQYIQGFSPSDYTTPAQVKAAVVSVTAVSDYRQSLQFRDLDKEKRKITIQVTSNGFRQKLSINDLLPGDIVHLAIGDQVPADGLFVSGFSVLIDESSLTGESEPVMLNSENPCMLSGTEVQDGSCKMMVATVGMRTQWDKLMATLSEGGDDETPLQVKLNGKALVRHLAACETMGNSTETFWLEFGLSLGGDFQAERQPGKLVRAEPFNSTKKQTGVVVELPGGGLRAHTKGASEIVLAACNKVINSNGDDEESINNLKATIDQFASEALRTLCMVLESGFSPDINPLPHSGHTCIGIAGIKDPVRPRVKESVAVCRSAGITVRMVTGDDINTA